MTDERPKPKYGELAPEGWVWQPPKEATPDPAPEASPAPVARPSDARLDPRGQAPDARSAAPGPAEPQAPGSAPAPARARNLAIDVNITIVMLVLGVLSVGSSVATLLDLNGYMTTAGAAFGLDAYPANEVTRIAGVTGAVVHVLLLAGVVWWSIRRIRAQKIAFWVPLSGAVVSFALTCICVGIAFAQAPELLDALTTFPTPTP